MSYRYMRLIVFFDLPTVTSGERKNYNKFRKFLINEGFIMMQESVYTKIALNMTVAKLVQDRVKKNKAPDGLIQMMVITEKQFANIEYVTGSKDNNILDSTNRLVVF